MDVKRVFSIFYRDLINSSREFLLVYIIIAPLLIACGLRFFIPSVNAISFQFALDDTLDQQVIETFERYGKVELVSNRDVLEARVNQIDDIIGITQDERGKFLIITEGNEKDSPMVASQIIHKLEGNVEEVEFTFSDLGATLSAVAVYGTSSVILMIIVLGGMVIGLNIIDEKEGRTISALNVTPMSQMEFILGKSLVGMLLPVVEAILVLWILQMLQVNLAMVIVMTTISSLVTIIFGFLIGVLSPNQIAGIANMKFLLILVSASAIGAMVLPAHQQYFMYWSPIYWSFVGFSDVVSNTATWAEIGKYGAWICALTVVLFVALRGRIRKGLQEAS